MPKTWSSEQAKLFWQKRNSYLVYTYPHQDDEIASYKTDLQNRLDKDTKDRQSFFASRVSLPMPTNMLYRRREYGQISTIFYQFIQSCLILFYEIAK